jgi:hypothetical protein
MKDIIRIEKSLYKLEQDFNKQLNALGNDTNDFHDALIDLTSKYPEHKDLLQFIVHINDKLEMKQNIFLDVMTDTFIDIINIKKELILKYKDDKECILKAEALKNPPRNKYLSWFFNFVGWLKDAKIFFISLSVVAVVIGLILSPETFLTILKVIAGIFS